MDPRSSTYGSISVGVADKLNTSKRPALLILGGCLFFPWLLFCTTFWLRSFDLRYAGERASHSSSTVEGWSLDLVNVLAFGLLAPVLILAMMTLNLARNGQPKGSMLVLTQTSAIAWICGFFLGDWNYRVDMLPYYEITDLNVYPAVDPSRFTGSQLMDAGMIQFTKGSRPLVEKSIGFKNEDVYCVAPVHAGANASQSVYDFWVVGQNCCSAQRPDFACGEIANPLARWGLRYMEDRYMDAKQSMFRLAVKEAEAAYSLKAPNPVFLYWLQDPMAEVDSHQEQGYNNFVTCVFSYFSVQLFLVLLLAGVMAKI